MTANRRIPSSTMNRCSDISSDAADVVMSAAKMKCRTTVCHDGHHRHRHREDEEFRRHWHLERLHLPPRCLLHVAASLAEFAEDAGDGERDRGEDRREADELHASHDVLQLRDRVRAAAIGDLIRSHGGEREADAECHRGHQPHRQPECATELLREVPTQRTVAE